MTRDILMIAWIFAGLLICLLIALVIFQRTQPKQQLRTFYSEDFGETEFLPIPKIRKSAHYFYVVGTYGGKPIIGKAKSLERAQFNYDKKLEEAMAGEALENA